MIRRFFLVSALLLFCNNSISQNQTFQKYGIKEGLSSSRVFTSIEDDLGFLWIATDVGVDRFDGANFKHYELSNFENIRRSSFYRFFLKKDQDNQIWLLVNNGSIYKYSSSQDKFVQFHNIKDQFGNPLVSNGLHIDHNGKFWIYSESGVYTFDVESKNTILNLEVSGSIHAFIQDNKNNFYLAGGNGVFVLNENYELVHNLLHKTLAPQVDINKDRIRSLFIDEKYNRLWMGTDQKGLCAFNLTDFELLLPPDLDNYIGLSIRSIEQYSSESLMVSIDGVGLIILDLNNLKPTHKFSFKQDDPNSLSANSIFDIYQNKDGIFFISTFRGGLNSYKPQQLNIRSFNPLTGENNSLENSNVLSICEVSGGVIGFGTAKGVSLWNKSKNSWIHLSQVASKQNILSGFVHAVAVDKNQNIWTASHTDYITRYNLIENDYYRISDEIPSEYNSGDIHSIYTTKGDLIYFANRANGVMSYSLVNGKTNTYPIEGISIIEPLTKDILALGGSGGLWILDKESAKIERPDFINSSIISEQTINSLFVDVGKRLWVGTADAGVFVINFQKNSIEQISKNEGLPSNYISSIVEANEYVWVSSPKGISRIDKKRNIYTLFESDGLISTDFNKNTVIKASDGNLYFGTNNGVVYFDPNDIRKVDSQKSLLLTDLYINHDLTLAGKNSPLDQALNDTNKIELKYSQNSFAIGFCTIDFIHPGIGEVEWKLEGFDKDWVSYSNIDRINYTNLSPSSYVLKLRIVNEQSDVLSGEKQIEIVVLPPFWGSNWAYLIYAIVLVIVVSVVFFLGKLKIESKHSEERLHYLINMAHDIKTPLTLIKAPLLDIVKNESVSTNVKQSVNIALRSANRLQKQMIQFLDFRKIKAQGSALMYENIDMQLFFQEKMLAFKVLCKRKNIKLTFNILESKFCISSDRKIIDVVVSNLITNAIKFTNENGNIIISLIVKNKLCEISVADTGIGIPKKQQKKIFKLFYRSPEALESGIPGSGVGLVLASDLASKIGGKVFLDKSSNEGSIFKFIFPYKLSSNVAVIENDLINQELNQGSKGEEKKIKLLIAEDDLELVDYCKSKLQDKYQIISASNGQSALEKVNKSMPDIVVTDVSMPKMNGRQLCMNLKSNFDTCHIPVILLTGLSSKENIIQGLDSGADEYITKPVEFDLLEKKIDGLLENRQILKRKFLQIEEEDNFELSNELDKSFLNEITKYIQDNISDTELSVHDLYEIFGMSRTPFYHKLKSLVDLSPSDYIRSIRLKRAKTLLKNRNNNISEVAYSVGFSNPKYFSTCFKKHFGQSPSAFVTEIRFGNSV